MHNQNQQQNNFEPSSQIPSQQNHGGHEMFDAHEAINCVVGAMEQNLLYEQHIQDPELKSIMQRQKQFTTQLYNTLVDSFKSGKDPSVPTQRYQMNTSNTVLYGMKPAQPTAPAQTVQEINDKCISGFMLGNLKAAASQFSMAAMEVANPVLRRLLADSIPNLIEMNYEIFLYQNKNHYYQVPQLKEEDMNIIMNSYAPIQNMTH